jgi:hypothetical protein
MKCTIRASVIYVCTHREPSYSQYLTDGVNHQTQVLGPEREREREGGRKERKWGGSERHYVLGGERNNISGFEISQPVPARRFDSIV